MPLLPMAGKWRAVLSDLTRKDRDFVWTNKEDMAFQALKNAAAGKVYVAHPNFAKKFFGYCDASGSAMGGVLLPKVDI